MPMFATNHATATATAKTTTMLPTAATEWSYVATGAEQHKPILAQRFRTKLCNKFAECGSCPYLHRCMFAHGEVELRSAGQNVADGLTSEEAIRAFKRYHFEADKLRSYQAAAAPQYQHDLCSHQGYFAGYATTNYRCGYGTESGADDDEMSLISHGSRTPPPSLVCAVGTASSSSSSPRRARRHDPYAETSAWHPLSLLESSASLSSIRGPSASPSPLGAYAKAL